MFVEEVDRALSVLEPFYQVYRSYQSMIGWALVLCWVAAFLGWGMWRHRTLLQKEEGVWVVGSWLKAGSSKLVVPALTMILCLMGAGWKMPTESNLDYRYSNDCSSSGGACLDFAVTDPVLGPEGQMRLVPTYFKSVGELAATCSIVSVAVVGFFAIIWGTLWWLMTAVFALGDLCVRCLRATYRRIPVRWQ